MGSQTCPEKNTVMVKLRFLLGELSHQLLSQSCSVGGKLWTPEVFTGLNRSDVRQISTYQLVCDLVSAETNDKHQQKSSCYSQRFWTESTGLKVNCSQLNSQSQLTSVQTGRVSSDFDVHQLPRCSSELRTRSKFGSPLRPKLPMFSTLRNACYALGRAPCCNLTLGMEVDG